MAWKKELKKEVVSGNTEINEQDFRKLQELTKDLYYAMRAFERVEIQQWLVDPATPDDTSKITGKLVTDYSVALNKLALFWSNMQGH